MKKVLVTGATGFLGKYLVDELKNNGYYVVAIGRNESVGKSLKTKNVEFIKCDFTNYDMLEKVFKNIDYVIHAGALSTVWGKWEDFYNANVLGTENVVKCCQKKSVSKLVYVSSPSIYSEKRDRLNIDENDFNENNELNYYIKSKIMSEKIVNEANSLGLNTTIIRPRGLFGIGDTSLIPRILKISKKFGVPLINNGENVVDITCVENVAYSLRLCLENADVSNGKIYNITNGEPTKFKEMIENFMNDIGMKAKYLRLSQDLIYGIASFIENTYKTFNIYKEPPLTKYTAITLSYSQTLNIDKAKKDLNYKPIITIKEGIKKYAEDYKKQ